MKEFAASVNEFLAFRRYQILPDRGRISKTQADKKPRRNTMNSIKHKKLYLILTGTSKG
jgi:hypothetical protein